MPRDWSDHLNPILVKEIRQYFHNYFILGITGLMLLAQLGALVYAQTEIQNGSKLDANAMTLIQMAILLLVAFAACGISGEVRFAAERGFPELDYSRISPLTPMQIVLGKSLGAVILTLYLVSLTVPFMLIAYFMRGISILDMLTIVLAVLLFSLFTAICGLFFGAAGKKWTIWLYIPALTLLVYFVINDDQWLVPMKYTVLLNDCWFLSLLLLAVVLVFTFTIALLGNRQSNRILPVRIYLALLPLLFILAAAISYTPHPTGVLSSFLGTAPVAGGSAAVAIISILAACERDSAGLKLLCNCPANPRLAKFKFLFSSGWSGGIALSWLLVILMTLLTLTVLVPANDLLFLKMVRSTTYPNPYIMENLKLIAFALYFLFYAEVSILLRKLLKIEGWICVVIVFFFFAILPIIIFGSKSQHQYYEDFHYLLTTPFNLQDVTYSSGRKLLTIYYTAWGLAVVGFIPICRGLWHNFRAFRRIEKEQLNEA